ncbi:hypothetical protein MN608_01514 [Microdochium nivale]|nr:hypothetical protein MN608_01514 [Microdochium nivale]
MLGEEGSCWLHLPCRAVQVCFQLSFGGGSERAPTNGTSSLARFSICTQQVFWAIRLSSTSIVSVLWLHIRLSDWFDSSACAKDHTHNARKACAVQSELRLSICTGTAKELLVMAVISGVPGLRATVRVNGAALVEYDDTESEPSPSGTVTKYIESVDGAEFTILTEVLDEYTWGYKDHELIINVFLDGKCLSGRVLQESSSQMQFNCSGTKVKMADTNQWMLRNFKFAPLNTVESSTQTGTTQNDFHDLGTIVVQVRREKPNHGAGKDRVSNNITALQVPEKALKGKAISHSTTFTDGKAIPPPGPVRPRGIKIDAKPIAVFRFNYRSRSALMDEMIIKRDSTPDPLDTLPLTELRKLARERLAAVNKPERKDSVSVKRERSCTIDLTREEPRKRARCLSPIDLTDC